MEVYIMNKNTKRVLSAITVASLSVTSFTGNIQNVVNAKEDKQRRKCTFNKSSKCKY